MSFLQKIGLMSTILLCTEQIALGAQKGREAGNRLRARSVGASAT